MYFSPPTKCFYDDILSNILYTISFKTHFLKKNLDEQFGLLSCSKQQFIVPTLILAFILLLLWKKVIFHVIRKKKYPKS